MYKIKSVSFTGLHNAISTKTYQLNSGLSYFYGSNGSGKSTVLQAIQLGLFGYIPGCNKTNSSILKHSCNGNIDIRLHIEDEQSNPIFIHRKWVYKGKSASSTCEIVPEGLDISQLLGSCMLPIFHLSEFLGMSSNKLKEWFVSILPSDLFNIDWIHEITYRLSQCDTSISDMSIILDVIAEMPSTNASEQNAYLHDSFKQILSGLKAEIKRCNSTIASLIYYDNIPSSLSSLEIQGRIGKLRQEYADIVAAENTQLKIASNRAMLADYEKKLKAAELELTTLLGQSDTLTEEQIDELIQQHETYQNQLYQLEYDLKNAINVLGYQGKCPYCNLECALMDKEITKYKAKAAELENAIIELRPKLAECKSLISEGQMKLKAKSRIDQNIFNLRDTINRLTAICYPEIEINKNVDISRKSAIESEIKEYEAQLSQIKANERYNLLISEITKEKFQLELDAAAINKCVEFTGSNGILSELLESAFNSLSDRVSYHLSYMMPYTTFKFKLSLTSNSFEFGIVRNGNYVSFDTISSGEKTIVILALFEAILEIVKPKLSLIMIDDMLDHLDTNMFEKCMQFIKNSNNQYIFAGVNILNDINIDPTYLYNLNA